MVEIFCNDRPSEDKHAVEGKGNFQNLFSDLVASVGSSVQSTNLNLSSCETIRDAAAGSASGTW